MAVRKLGSIKYTDDVLLTSVNLATEVTGTLAVANGGTGQTVYTDGQLLIGNTVGNTLTKATLTAGSGISITNGNGSITIAATAGSGDVTGPASSTDNAIARFDGTGGKTLQNSAVTITDNGTINFVAANTSYPSFNIPAGTDPTVPTSGDFWSTSNGIFYNHSAAGTVPVNLRKNLTSDTTSTSTTPATVTGLNISVAASTRYQFRVVLLFRSSVQTVGLRIAITYPTANDFAATVRMAAGSAGTSGEWSGYISTSGGQVTATQVPAANTDYICEIVGIADISSAGTISFQIARETDTGGATITVKAGSFVEFSTV